MNAPQLPYYRAPSGLRDRVQASLRDAPTVRRRPSAVRWPSTLATAAALVLAVGLGWRLGNRRGQDSLEASSVLSAHFRSLTPGHLADVASTDQHTVKPWFAGKLDFSPIVVDPAAAGFPLVGGRVDYVNGRPAAALVYNRRLHVINVFEQPLAAGDDAGVVTEERRGINLLRWSDKGMRFWAASDLNMQELDQLRTLLEAP